MLPNMFKVNNISSFQAFQLLKYAGQLFISISLAKSGLNKSYIGQFEYFNFIASGVSFFWVTGIMKTLLSNYPTQQTAKNSLFFNTAVYILSVSALSIVLILLYLNFTDNVITHYHINILLLYALINPIGFLIEHILLLIRRFKALVVFGFFTMFTPLLLISLPLFMTKVIDYSILGLLIWAVLKLLIAGVLIYRESILKIDVVTLKNLVKDSLPLMGASLVAGSSAYIDGYIISQNYNADVFAVFRYGAKEFPVFLIIANAFSVSMIPEVSREGNLQFALDKIKTNSRKMMFYMFPMAIVLVLISKYLYVLVFSSDFEQSYIIFNIYLLLLMSRLIFTNSILIGLKQNIIILIVSVAELTVNVVFSLIFMQYWGYIGVAYGTLVAYFFEKIILAIIIKRKNNIKLSDYLPLKTLVLFSLFLIVCYWVSLNL